jgi:hypothetical protein
MSFPPYECGRFFVNRMPFDNRTIFFFGCFLFFYNQGSGILVTINGVEIIQMGYIVGLVSVCRVLQMQGTGHADVL